MRTLGVEEEMLLVDARSGLAVPASDRVLRYAAERAHEAAGARLSPERAPGVCGHGAVEGEFQQQMIETHTAPAAGLGDLRSELWRWRGEAVAAARGAGADVAALATSPLPVQPVVSGEPRYLWLEDRYRLTAREHLVCGCHVHVSVAGDEEGVAVLDRIRVWLPTLLALSANSPFWQGRTPGSRATGRGCWCGCPRGARTTASVRPRPTTGSSTSWCGAR